MLSSRLAILFLVPPVNLACLAAIGLLARRRRWGLPLAAACLSALLALALPVVSGNLLSSLEHGLRPNAPGLPPQAILVLGAEVAHGTDAAGAPAVLPGPLTLQRLAAAARLARASHLPVLVTGGVVAPSTPPVARVMADALRTDFATPVRWIEPRAADTWQNAADSAALLRRAGISRVLLVTHAWHLRRALIALRAADLAAIPAPPFWDAPTPLTAGALLPHATAWLAGYYALHEWTGCLWYALRAAAGRHHR